MVQPRVAARSAPVEVIRVLILGGTAEARAVARQLVGDGYHVTTSLAGRVSSPALPEGHVRIGGFGGIGGLMAYLVRERVAVLVDATHPFASTMTQHALEAATMTGIPLLRLARPGWTNHALADKWHWVDDHNAARVTAESLGTLPFLTTGRQTLGHYAQWTNLKVLIRVVEPPSSDLPRRWQVILDRGPYTLDGELALLARHTVDVVVTKNSGGTYTEAKLLAAQRLGIPVVVVRRPPTPAGLTCVESAKAARQWINHVAGG